MLGVGRKIFPVRQQNVFLSFDELAFVTRQARVFGFADFIERFAEVPQHMELVEQNRSLRRVRVRRIAERLPHVHDRETYVLGVVLA
jgi:hypothetical protein